MRPCKQNIFSVSICSFRKLSPFLLGADNERGCVDILQLEIVGIGLQSLGGGILQLKVG